MLTSTNYPQTFQDLKQMLDKIGELVEGKKLARHVRERLILSLLKMHHVVEQLVNALEKLMGSRFNQSDEVLEIIRWCQAILEQQNGTLGE